MAGSTKLSTYRCSDRPGGNSHLAASWPRGGHPALGSAPLVDPGRSRLRRDQRRPVCCSGGHYWHTPEPGGKYRAPIMMAKGSRDLWIKPLMIVARWAFFRPGLRSERVRSAWSVWRDENRPTFATSADHNRNKKRRASSSGSPSSGTRARAFLLHGIVHRVSSTGARCGEICPTRIG